ncbi:MAG TPA: biotin carboxyl carrier protein [Chloroflexota bacterium]|jgi:oxaloacetate decarboxylase alpha subunit
MSTEIRFIDTTVRDGNQSLWALNMRTGMMLAALPDLAAAGFEAMEFFVPGVQIKKLAQHLGEDPFLWLKRGTALCQQTPLRMHGGIRGGLSKIPYAVSRRLAEIIAAQGIRTTRTSEPWNDFTSFGPEVEDLRTIGLQSVVNVIYSESPKHTDAYYAERARQAAALNPYRICFKDVGGLLTPERTRQVARILRDAVGDIPLEFHAHSNNGLAPLNALEAVKEGIRYVHTAVPPLAYGTSQPSIFNVAANLRTLGYTPVVDEAPLRRASERLTGIARRYDLPIGQPLEFDYGQYAHQVPGGMMSNLRYQLRLLGLEHRFQATLEEAGRVRAEFGYPIMVTPLSQFVGTQAAFNVILGERYKEVPDEVIQLALGYWGKEPVTDMDQAVRAKILDRPRAREWERWEQPQPSLAEIRREYGAHLSDEEIVLRFYAGEDGLKVVGKSSEPEEYLSARHPVVELVDKLAQKRDLHHIQVQTGELSLSLSRGAPGV